MAEVSGTSAAIKALGMSITQGEAARVIESYSGQLQKLVYARKTTSSAQQLIDRYKILTTRLKASSSVVLKRPSESFNEIIVAVGGLYGEIYASAGMAEIRNAAQAQLVDDMVKPIEKLVEKGSDLLNTALDIPGAVLGSATWLVKLLPFLVVAIIGLAIYFMASGKKIPFIGGLLGGR